MTTESKPGRCGFNENILCTKTICHECGWHPKVADERRRTEHDRLTRDALLRRFTYLLDGAFTDAEMLTLDVVLRHNGLLEIMKKYGGKEID